MSDYGIKQKTGTICPDKKPRAKDHLTGSLNGGGTQRQKMPMGLQQLSAGEQIHLHS